MRSLSLIAVIILSCGAAALVTPALDQHECLIRVYDAAGNVIETHEHKGECKGRERHRVKQRAAMR